MPRRFVVVLVIVIVAAGSAWLWSRREEVASAKPMPKQTLPAIATAASAVSATPAAAPAKSENGAAAGKLSPLPDPADDLGRIATVDALGAPGGTIGADLTMLVTLFEDWRSFFPGDGNPWGSNAEITAALLGKNRRHLVFVGEAHRALNADGELCDRWGTPFRFHALGGDRMEIRSAGPDKKFGTDDDAVVSPP